MGGSSGCRGWLMRVWSPFPCTYQKASVGTSAASACPAFTPSSVHSTLVFTWGLLWPMCSFLPLHRATVGLMTQVWPMRTQHQPNDSCGHRQVSQSGAVTPALGRSDGDTGALLHRGTEVGRMSAWSCQQLSLPPSGARQTEAAGGTWGWAGGLSTQFGGARSWVHPVCGEPALDFCP